ncbi:MAG: type II CAAX endopeptidase family protein [Candidatus Omnitrophota bacterium]|jgi:hypothetical protein
MKALFKGLLRFLRKEKLYTALLVALLVVIALSWAGSVKHAPAPGGEGAREAVETYQRAEEAFQQKVEQAGSMEDYLAVHPEARHIFYLLTLGLCLLLGGGLAVDLMWVFRSDVRRRFARPPLQSRVPWSVAMLAKVLILLGASVVGVGILAVLTGHALRLKNAENLYLLLHATAVDALCFFYVLHFVRKAGGTLSDLGLGAPEGGWVREAARGFAAYLAVIPVFVLTLVLALMVAQFLNYQPPAHPLVGVFLEEEKRSPGLVAYSILLATVLGPCLEEVFFRGFCYPILKRRFGMIPAMAASAAFFAFIHENSFAFWPIFVLGLALVYVYEKRKSLVAPVVLHVTHNCLFLGYFFLVKQVIL